MSSFSPPRFGRVMLNDLLRIMRPALIATIALFGVTVGIYLIGVRGGRASYKPVHELLFGLNLVIAGMIFTGLAFRDMHHPLERNQYLMLPVSNLERLLSRYLLTGPLFVLYGTLAFLVVDHVGNQLTHMWISKTQPPFSPAAAETMSVIKGYLLAHLAVFIGAICFRSHALLKTILFLVLALCAATVVEYVTARIFFPELFSWTQFGKVRPFPLELQPWFTASWMNIAFVIGAVAWALYVAYLCLRDHEATDGV